MFHTLQILGRHVRFLDLCSKAGACGDSYVFFNHLTQVSRATFLAGTVELAAGITSAKQPQCSAQQWQQHRTVRYGTVRHSTYNSMLCCCSTVLLGTAVCSTIISYSMSGWGYQPGRQRLQLWRLLKTLEHHVGLHDCHMVHLATGRPSVLHRAGPAPLAPLQPDTGKHMCGAVTPKKVPKHRGLIHIIHRQRCTHKSLCRGVMDVMCHVVKCVHVCAWATSG